MVYQNKSQAQKKAKASQGEAEQQQIKSRAKSKKQDKDLAGHDSDEALLVAALESALESQVQESSKATGDGESSATKAGSSGSKGQAKRRITRTRRTTTAKEAAAAGTAASDAAASDAAVAVALEAKESADAESRHSAEDALVAVDSADTAAATVEPDKAGGEVKRKRKARSVKDTSSVSVSVSDDTLSSETLDESVQGGAAISDALDAAASSETGSGTEEQSSSQILPSSMVPQGVIGANLLESVGLYNASLSAHQEQRSGVGGDNNVRLKNGRTVHLRQFLPESALLPEHLEKKVERDYNSGFIHYANELLLTHALEDLGARPFAPLSADYIHSMIRELAPQISEPYIEQLHSFFMGPWNYECFQQSYEENLELLRKSSSPFASSLPPDFLAFCLKETREEESNQYYADEYTRSLSSTYIDFLNRYEWLLSILIADFKQRISAQKLDELIFYYYLLAQTTNSAYYFSFCDKLVEIQNSICLFELMRYSYVSMSDFLTPFAKVSDIPHPISEINEEEEVEYPFDDKFTFEPKLLFGSILPPDVTLSGELPENVADNIDERKDRLDLEVYEASTISSRYILDKKKAAKCSGQFLKVNPKAKESGKRINLAFGELHEAYRIHLRDFLARNGGTLEAIKENPRQEERDIVLSQKGQGTGIPFDAYIRYSSLKEMDALKPCLWHFCYLHHVREYMLRDPSASLCLTNLLDTAASIVLGRASQHLYAGNDSYFDLFVPSVRHFIAGERAWQVGVEALEQGSEKIQNPETLKMFLFELFFNTNIKNLSPALRRDYESLMPLCEEQDIVSGVQTGQCSDELKEVALHLYHNRLVRESVELPIEGDQEDRNQAYLKQEAVSCCEELICFYTKYKLNVTYRSAIEEHGNFKAQLYRERSKSAKDNAACFGLNNQGQIVVDELAFKMQQELGFLHRNVRLEDKEQRSKKHESQLLGNTGFIPLIPGMSAHTAFLIGRAYSTGEFLKLNRIWGYNSLVYATSCGDYQAPTYLALHYEPLFDAAYNKQGLLTLQLHLQACLALALGKSSCLMPYGAVHLNSCYKQQLDIVDYNTAFKLWQQNEALHPIFARNPTLMRLDADEEVLKKVPKPDVGAAIVSNTVILMCDILDRYPSLHSKLTPKIKSLMYVVMDYLKHTYSPDCCFAIYTFLMSTRLDFLNALSPANVRLRSSNILVELLYRQLLFGWRSINDKSYIDADIETMEFHQFHIAFMFLQLGMISPEYREQGYNLLSLSINRNLGNFTPMTVPYMDEFYRTAAAYQNGTILSYLSSIKKGQERIFKPQASVNAAAVEVDATGTAYATGTKVSTAAPLGASRTERTAASAAASAAAAAAAGGADAAGDDGVLKSFASSASKASSGAPQDVAKNCGELSTLYAMLGVRFGADACYKEILHYYQLHGLDEERIRLAFEMVALRRPMGYFELYLNLKDKEEFRADAHSYLFFAARMNISEAIDELEALERTDAFKPLAFITYWLYLEELAKTNVQALMCLLFLSQTGLIVPYNSLKMSSLLERHHRFFSSSSLYGSLCKAGFFQSSDPHFNGTSLPNSHFNLFHSEEDNHSFINTENFGNFAKFSEVKTGLDFLSSRYIDQEITDPKVKNLICKMILRLGSGDSMLERYIVANLCLAENWPEWMSQSISKAANMACNFHYSVDPIGIDINLGEVLIGFDLCAEQINESYSLGQVFSHDACTLLKSPSYTGFKRYLHMGVIPLSLSAMHLYCLLSVRDEHRPSPVLFSRMCRFLANMGYLIPSFYSHSNVHYLEQMPYGEVFLHYAVKPYYRDLLQSAEQMSKVSAEGKLLQGLVALLEEVYFNRGDNYSAPAGADNSGFAALVSDDLQGVVPSANDGELTAIEDGGSVKTGKKRRTSGKGKSRAQNTGAGAAGAAGSYVKDESSISASDDSGVHFTGDEIHLAKQLTHFELRDYLQQAKDFVQSYQDFAQKGLNNILSLDLDDLSFVLALFGTGLKLHARDLDAENELTESVTSEVYEGNAEQSWSACQKLKLVNLQDTLALDLQRLLLLENADLGEVIKSYSVAAFGSKVKDTGARAGAHAQSNEPRALTLSLPPLRCGRLGEFFAKDIKEEDLHLLGHFILAYLRYEYFLHSRGFDLHDMLLSSRNGWTLGKSHRLNAPQRSYASLLAADALQGSVEAYNRYNYYVQSHLFKFMVNPSLYAEDANFGTARNFVQDVLQLDIGSEKFREFAQSMKSEGFTEFDTLRKAYENGYVDQRHRFCMPNQSYNSDIGYTCDYEMTGDAEDHDTESYCFNLLDKEALIARDQLKQIAGAIDALQGLSPQNRATYFTLSDETLFKNQVPQYSPEDLCTLGELPAESTGKKGAVELRLTLERILGKDHLNILVNAAQPEQYFHYTFSADGTFNFSDFIALMPYDYTMLPSQLLRSWEGKDQAAAFAYMQSLSTQGRASLKSPSYTLKRQNEALKAALDAYHNSSEQDEISEETLHKQLLSEQLYSTEFWGLSFDQRLSRWHQSKEELLLAIGREYSCYLQQFDRLRTYNSCYGPALYQHNSFIWHLHQHLKQEGKGGKSKENVVIAAKAHADLDASAFEPGVDFTPDDLGLHEERKISLLQLQEEQELFNALQKGERYTGDLFGKDEDGSELLANSKSAAQYRGQYFADDGNYSLYEEQNAKAYAATGNAVSLTTATAAAAAAAGKKESALGQDLGLLAPSRATLDYPDWLISPQAMRNTLVKLGFDVEKIPEESFELLLSSEYQAAANFKAGQNATSSGERRSLDDALSESEDAKMGVNIEGASIFKRLKSFVGDKLGVNFDSISDKDGAAAALQMLTGLSAGNMASFADRSSDAKGAKRRLVHNEFDARSPEFEPWASLLNNFDLRNDRQYTRPFLFHEEENPLHVAIYVLLQTQKTSALNSNPLIWEQKFAKSLDNLGYFFGGVDLIDMGFFNSIRHSIIQRFSSSQERSFFHHIASDYLQELYLPSLLPPDEIPEFVEKCTGEKAFNFVNQQTRDLAPFLNQPKNASGALLFAQMKRYVEIMHDSARPTRIALLSFSKAEAERSLLLFDDTLPGHLFVDLYERPAVLYHSPTVSSTLFLKSRYLYCKLCWIYGAYSRGLLDRLCVTSDALGCVVDVSTETAKMLKRQVYSYLKCKSLGYQEYLTALAILGFDGNGNSIWPEDVHECPVHPGFAQEGIKPTFKVFADQNSHKYLRLLNPDKELELLLKDLLGYIRMSIYGYYDDERQLLLHQNLPYALDSRAQSYPVQFDDLPNPYLEKRRVSFALSPLSYDDILHLVVTALAPADFAEIYKDKDLSPQFIVEKSKQVLANLGFEELYVKARAKRQGLSEEQVRSLLDNPNQKLGGKRRNVFEERIDNFIAGTLSPKIEVETEHQPARGKKENEFIEYVYQNWLLLIRDIIHDLPLLQQYNICGMGTLDDMDTPLSENTLVSTLIAQFSGLDRSTYWRLLYFMNFKRSGAGSLLPLEREGLYISSAFYDPVDLKIVEGRRSLRRRRYERAAAINSILNKVSVPYTIEEHRLIGIEQVVATYPNLDGRKLLKDTTALAPKYSTEVPFHLDARGLYGSVFNELLGDNLGTDIDLVNFFAPEANVSYEALSSAMPKSALGYRVSARQLNENRMLDWKKFNVSNTEEVISRALYTFFDSPPLVKELYMYVHPSLEESMYSDDEEDGVEPWMINDAEADALVQFLQENNITNADEFANYIVSNHGLEMLGVNNQGDVDNIIKSIIFNHDHDAADADNDDADDALADSDWIDADWDDEEQGDDEYNPLDTDDMINLNRDERGRNEREVKQESNRNFAQDSAANKTSASAKRRKNKRK